MLDVTLGMMCECDGQAEDILGSTNSLPQYDKKEQVRKEKLLGTHGYFQT
jgi:hypothetical protein